MSLFALIFLIVAAIAMLLLAPVLGGALIVFLPAVGLALIARELIKRIALPFNSEGPETAHR